MSVSYGEDPAVAYAGIFAQSTGISKAWAWSNGDSDILMLRRTARDVDGNKRRSLVQFYELKAGQLRQTSPFPLELHGAVSISPSPSGRLLAIIREAPSEGKAAQKDYVIEIWTNDQSGGSLVDQIPTAGLHERIVADGWFGEPSWSPDESKLVYVAQRKARCTSSFFAKTTDRPDDESFTPGNKFLYDEDWGEKYNGVSRLGLFIADLSGSGNVQEVPGISSDLTPGQARFSGDGKHLVYVAWEHKPRKLGMIYCYQRPCNLYSVSVADMLTHMESTAGQHPHSDDETAASARGCSGEHKCLCPSWKLARSPRFSPSGDRLVLLSREEGFDTHNGCFRLTSAAWDAQSGTFAGAPRTLVDTVDVPAGPDGFPGLWIDNLPDSCWSADGSSIYLTSMWGSRESVLKVNADSGRVERVVAATEVSGQDPCSGRCADASASVLAVSKSGVFVTASSPNSPGGFGAMVPRDESRPEVVMGPPVGGALVATYPRVSRAERLELKEALAGVRWRVVSVPVHDGAGAAAAEEEQSFEAILLMPPAKSASRDEGSAGSPSRVPLLVAPHGGPHGVVTTAFLPPYTCICATQGIAVLLVNFRGSTGFGTAALESLLGRIGEQDVADVVAATKVALASEPQTLDPDRVAITGGSHGGFLGCHLTAQHPDIFKVAVMRNPATNNASKVSTNDIPDWCYIEIMGRGSYEWDTFRPPTGEELKMMWEASPVKHIKGVRAPTMLVLGSKDRRVPPSQGLEWFHALKTAGVEVELLVYPEDEHAIDKPASEADMWVNLMRWLKKHL